MRRWLFPILYWLGILLALTGVWLRFWLQSLALGLALAVVGVGLILAVRVASKLRRPAERRRTPDLPGKG